MSEHKSEVITIKKDDLWKYSTFLLGAIAIIMAFALFTGNDSGSVAAPSPSAPSAPAPTPTPSEVQIDVDDDPILGDPDAPLTIIEFSDYECPFCARFWSQTLPEIKSKYIDTGKVRLVYRDFPLNSIHPNAQPAAEAAECVREKGGDEAYYEYHDLIFQNQQSLSNTKLVDLASNMGHDIGSCLSSGKYSSEVEKDLQDGADAGVRGTPGFFILKGDSGKATPISGAQPFSVFEQIIEANL